MKENDLEKVERYIIGVADDNEKAEVESLFSEGENDLALKALLKKDWDSTTIDSLPSDVDLSHLLDRIHHSIRKSEHQEKQSVITRFSKVYVKVAAILLLPVLVAGGWLYTKLNDQSDAAPEQIVTSTISAPMGSRVAFNLPDGTTGMLNSGSNLTYSTPFSSKRRVSLEGEAWFDVMKDENHPFEISAGNSALKVLGTSFNVSAYPAENYVEVVLQEGKVEFNDNLSQASVVLIPSERLVFQNGKISKSMTDPAKYRAWTKGRMVFSNDPMAEVARRIERWYNVKVVLADKELERYSFRGTFEDDKLDEVFRLLAMTSPIKYQITPRKLSTDGSYEKEIVTIFLRKN